MKIRLVGFFTALLILFSFNLSAQAAPLDLSGWSVQAWDYSGNPQGNWVLSADNISVRQTLNADPSAFLNGEDQSNYLMRGAFRAATSIDDDYMGFVFGYQNPSNFYVFDWKQANQGTSLEGFSVRKISAPSVSDLIQADFANFPSTTNMTVLASDFGSDKGWDDNTWYNFALDFKIGDFQITITDGSDILWDVTLNDTSFGTGQFGLWNHSQPSAEYANLEQTFGQPVPEPATMLLLGSGLVSLAGISRRKFFKK